ncbi:hypothetical protein [Brevundimonas sp. SPF441]|uniref:hypothetical protein n=1 Tax=Brevundimonas sp. SPF441 TaxID=2663795 RepID=UPI00129E2AC6|nr:hypothetical protein [Brevundimonas sp. SPF441]MRL69994.1 hypothetical protein [Brevundimonas sp. SPF441]
MPNSKGVDLLPKAAKRSSRQRNETLKDDPSKCLPCLIVATGPFTTIILNEDDKLDTSLEQINSHNYDRVRLCRTTMEVDVGLGSLPALFSYTAAWIFPPIRGITPQRAIDLVNKVHFELLLGGVRFDSAAPEDVGQGYTYNTGYFLASGGLTEACGVNLSRLQGLIAGDVSTYDSIALFQPRSFTAAEINAALAKGRSIAKHAPWLNSTIVLDGLTALKNRRGTSSLIFLWTACEALLGGLWDRHVATKGAGVAGRKVFINGRDWTAAHKAEVFFQLGMFDEILYGQINQVRKARNKAAHNGQTPELSVCSIAAELVFSLLSLVVTQQDAKAIRSLGQFYRLVPDEARAEPVAWRHLPAVPGNERWGDKDYPRYPEREWVPLPREVLEKLK